MTDRDDERQLPPPLPERLISNDFRNGKRRQERVPRPPVRAIAVKAAELRAAARINPLDFEDIHARYADLWAECRMVIWRAKHSKRALSTRDPLTGAEVDGFVPDDKTVLAALEVARGILDSMVRVRKEMGPDASSIPRWAVNRIARALRDYPEALQALLKELAASEKE